MNCTRNTNVVVVVVVVVIGKEVQFRHEQLAVYRVSIRYVTQGY
jgi:hypothetical protein